MGALALHVLDETVTHFLDFYNPFVLDIRSRFPLFPMPTFTFEVWLTGLLVLVFALALLTPAVRRGGFASQLSSWAFAAVMFLNGLGHLAGSIYFRQWLPGTTSAPLLLVASVLLARAASVRAPAAQD